MAKRTDSSTAGEAPIKPLPGQMALFPGCRARKRNRISEEQFQAQVISLAHLRGWRIAHFRPGMNRRGQWQTAVSADGKGFPDLFMVRRSTHHRLAAELKVPPNKLTDEQREWLSDMETCGIPAYEWTPADWQEIERVLEHGPEETE